MPRLALIGMGSRVSHMLCQMGQLDKELEIVAIADPGVEGVKTRLAWQHMPRHDRVKFYDNEDRLLEHADQYDGILIGTRCHLHTPMAVKVAKTNLPLFLEKPVAITKEQVTQLARAFEGREDRVVVSFPLRVTPLFVAALEIVRSGRLGTITQVQAWNNVPYGGVYFGNWYRNYPEVGGLWLQKATHDFDYINRMLGEQPKQVAATITRKVYVGDKPHDLVCSKCELIDSCPESAKNQRLRGDGGGMSTEDHPCAFSREIRNEDAGSAIVQYASGTHVAYSQNFVARRKAGARGARVIGYLGTLEFDWYTDQIRVVDHHAERVDNIEVKATSGHGGGDAVLCQMFIDLVRHRDRSRSDLRDGLLSAAMCLAARESSYTNTFQRIPSVEELPNWAPTTPAREAVAV
jgi:predicted dehydrogenase